VIHDFIEHDRAISQATTRQEPGQQNRDEAEQNDGKCGEAVPRRSKLSVAR
jgi:hypothetical protein